LRTHPLAISDETPASVASPQGAQRSQRLRSHDDDQVAERCEQQAALNLNQKMDVYRNTKECVNLRLQGLLCPVRPLRDGTQQGRHRQSGASQNRLRLHGCMKILAVSVDFQTIRPLRFSETGQSSHCWNQCL
jgi:hypothetical protein